MTFTPAELSLLRLSDQAQCLPKGRQRLPCADGWTAHRRRLAREKAMRARRCREIDAEQTAIILRALKRRVRHRGEPEKGRPRTLPDTPEIEARRAYKREWARRKAAERRLGAATAGGQ